MSKESNKETVRRFFAGLSRHDPDEVVSLVSDDLSNHAAVAEAQGAAGLRIIMGKLLEAFPDGAWEPADLIAEGDRVACRVRMTGTNTGPVRFVALPLPASGKRIETESIHMFRLVEGKIVEHWGGRDDIGILRQLGQLDAVARAS